MLAPTSDGAFLGTSAQGGNAGSQSAAYTTRTTNTIRFATDRMAGFIGKASYTLSNRDTTQIGVTTSSNQVGGNNNQNGYQLALDYVFQKANVQASYASFTSENPFTATPNTATLGNASWGGGTQGNNVKDAQTLITASYDFGILKAYAGWTDRKVTSSLNSNFYLKRTAQEIGVRSFITPKIEGWASVGNGRFSAFGNSAPTANITGYQLGSNYWMSKRTNLYAIYGQNGTSSTTNGSFNAGQYSIGARHTF
jgi:hypothetical protein